MDMQYSYLIQTCMISRLMLITRAVSVVFVFVFLEGGGGGGGGGGGCRFCFFLFFGGGGGGVGGRVGGADFVLWTLIESQLDESFFAVADHV